MLDPWVYSTRMDAAVREILTELLKRLALPYQEITTQSVANQRVFTIYADEGKQLIGMRGETIRAIDYLVKKMLEERGTKGDPFFIDVNDYRRKQIEEIQARARMMAERARSFQYDVELTPMSSYERLIVHSTLADEESIVTESHGEGRERRVVIRYQQTIHPGAETTANSEAGEST